MAGFRFPKDERICSKKDIERIFAEAKTVRKGQVTLKYLWLDRGQRPPSMVLVVVPKKKVRLAVNRNLVKRQLREIYRLNKSALPIEKTSPHCLQVAIIYNGTGSQTYVETEKAYLRAVEKIELPSPPGA